MNPAQTAVRLAEVLSRRNIPYAIGGAIAYGYWAVARATQGVDINLFISPAEIDHAIDALCTVGLEIDRDDARRRTQERGDAIGYVESTRIDIFVNSIALHESAAKRVVEVKLLGTSIKILSAEDLTTLKMLFFRGKDIVDIERILAMGGTKFDRSYVRHWLTNTVGDTDERVIKWDALCSQIQ